MNVRQSGRVEGGRATTGSAAVHGEVDHGWRRIGRASGLVAGGALVAGTVLYLLDATDALAASPDYHVTGLGALHDEATYWIAYFSHQRDILWSIVARDTLFPLAFLALIVLALAVRHTIGGDRPSAQLMVAFFVVGGTISTLSDLIFLGASDYWRVTGWTDEPAVRMVAVGYSEGAIESVTTWPEAAGFVVLAAALVCLGMLCRSDSALPSGLGLAAYAEALLLLGIALAGVLGTDTAYDVLSLVTGAIVGPLVAIWLGLHLGRPERQHVEAQVVA